jgi:protein tyrosine phosphatase (PTP) superfamily phosphohydrolase (DUF442 family)
MKNSSRLFALAALLVIAVGLVGCHTVSQCPILQGMANWTLPSPLPPEGDAYDVAGYRDGIRFYVVKHNENLYRSGDMLTPQGADALKGLGVKTIITTSESPEQRAWATERGMNYVEIPFGWNDMTEGNLHAFLEAYDANPKPVAVISRTGTIRGGILVAWYHVQRDGWSTGKSLDEYYRLQANIFDAMPAVMTFKNAAAATPAEPKPAVAPAPAPAAPAPTKM